MPYVSKAQQGYFHTAAGRKKVGAKVVAEFDAASKGKSYRKLPKHVKRSKLKQYGGDRP
jgi:hypothetical protein